jgi:four helix bundle protein
VGNEESQRTPAKTFREVLAWQSAHRFALEIYTLTGGFPRHELYGLTAQFRRAAISIPANIAEGFKKRSKLDKARFLNQAQGSLEECKYYLLLAHDLGYGNSEVCRELSEEVGRLLQTYHDTILKDAQA